MKKAYAMLLFGLCFVALLISGCESAATEPEQSNPPPERSISEPPSAALVLTDTAAPDPVPDLPVLYPFYIHSNTYDDYGAYGTRIWGYMDRKGSTIIESEFDEAGFFNQEGIAVVGKLVNGVERYGLINAAGQFVIEPLYSRILQSEGLYVAVADTRSDLIAEDGHVIRSNIEGQVDEFSEGKAVIDINGQEGIIDRQGNFVVKPQYGHIHPYVDGQALAYIQENQYTLLNDKGEQGRVYNVKYIAEPFSNGLAPTRWTEDSQYGYMNEEGELVIPAQYEYARSFHDGLAIVSMQYDDQMGLIDVHGNYVLQPQIRRYYLFGQIIVGGVQSEPFNVICRAGSRSKVCDLQQ